MLNRTLYVYNEVSYHISDGQYPIAEKQKHGSMGESELWKHTFRKQRFFLNSLIQVQSIHNMQ